ncbi:hypothetical protein OC835_007817, partial [Tilletia horrida]
MVRYLAVIGRHWSPAVRLAMYKTLARPLFDYAGGLLWHIVFSDRVKTLWHMCHDAYGPTERKAHQELRKTWQTKLASHHRLATHWITRRATENAPVAVLSSITGLNDPETRMYKLAVMLHEHMTRLDPVSVATQRIHGLS